MHQAKSAFLNVLFSLDLTVGTVEQHQDRNSSDGDSNRTTGKHSDKIAALGYEATAQISLNRQARSEGLAFS